MQTAFALAGGLISAVGQSQGQNYEAARAKRAAEIGRIQADQTDASYRQELNSTLANIRALRAGGNVGLDSPTGMAIDAKQVATSDRDRRIEVGNRRMQANQDEEDARFRRASAKYALFGGAASTIGKNWTGLTGFFGS